MKIRKRIKNFYRRWDIEYDNQRKFQDFKGRTLTSIDEVLGMLFLGDERYERSFMKIIGKHYARSSTLLGFSIPYLTRLQGMVFSQTRVYNLFMGEKNFKEFVKLMQVLFWLNLPKDKSTNLYKNFKEDIELSQMNLAIKKCGENCIIIYPLGAKILDEKLVNDVLEWLEEYPKSKKYFLLALKGYSDKDNPRNILDNLRFSLEQLIKKILKNRKSLEKQKDYLMRYLSECRISQEIASMYVTLIAQYTKYQNENVKHNEKCLVDELDFIIYLTGNFIRFIVQISNKKKSL